MVLNHPSFVDDREWVPLWDLVALAEAALWRGATEASVAGAWGIGVDELRDHLERDARGGEHIQREATASIVREKVWWAEASSEQQSCAPDREAIMAILRRVTDRLEADGLRARSGQRWSRTKKRLSETFVVSPGRGSMDAAFVLSVDLVVKSTARTDPDHPEASFQITDDLGEPMSTVFTYADACIGGSGLLRIVRWDRTEEGDEALASLDAGLTWLLGIPERMREHGLDHIDVNNAKLSVRRRFLALGAI